MQDDLNFLSKSSLASPRLTWAWHNSAQLVPFFSLNEDNELRNYKLPVLIDPTTHLTYQEYLALTHPIPPTYQFIYLTLQFFLSSQINLYILGTRQTACFLNISPTNISYWTFPSLILPTNYTTYLDVVLYKTGKNMHTSKPCLGKFVQISVFFFSLPAISFVKASICCR